MSKYVFVKINDDITSIKRLKEMFPKIEEEDFETVLKSDPTYNNSTTESGKYGRWLLSCYNKGNLKKEDLYKAKEYLEKFDKKKAKFSNKDINAYKNLPDLYKAIEEIEEKEPTKSELKRNVQRTDLDKDAELFMETENFKIYIPKTYEASCKLGSDTQWCTATRSDRGYYDDYTSDGNELYVMISKNDPSEKYQWNTKERYTCDRKDKEISSVELCLKYHDLIKFFNKFGYDIEKIIKEAQEYEKGKEYIYDGKEIDEDVVPYLKKVRISNDVERIDEEAFWGYSSLTNITIPNSVTSIGNSAFVNCSSLTSIEIPNSVTSIENNAFCNCSSLTNITIPNSVTSIGISAFANCSSLTSITIPNSVKNISFYTFAGCSSLTSIEIPNGVEWIRDFAFQGCSSLKTVTIPNSVSFIESAAFDQNSSENLVIKTKNPYAINFCKKERLKYSEE